METRKEIRVSEAKDVFFQRYKVTFRYYVCSHQMAGVLEKTVFAVSPKHSRAGRIESSIAFVAYTTCQEFLAKVNAEYAVFR